MPAVRQARSAEKGYVFGRVRCDRPACRKRQSGRHPVCALWGNVSGLPYIRCALLLACLLYTTQEGQCCSARPASVCGVWASSSASCRGSYVLRRVCSSRRRGPAWADEWAGAKAHQAEAGCLQTGGQGRRYGASRARTIWAVCGLQYAGSHARGWHGRTGAGSLSYNRRRAGLVVRALQRGCGFGAREVRYCLRSSRVCAGVRAVRSAVRCR